MFPIFEQGKGKGIGFTISSFYGRFDEICHEHLRSKKAKAFAFIFYDFKNGELRKILKDQGVFAKIDRLSGNNLSVFYLHSGNKAAVTDFNSEFLSKLGVADKATLPCVVFFKLKDDKIENVAIAQLDSADLLHGFQELYDVIERYIEAGTNELSIQMKYLRWIKSGVAFIATEVFRVGLKSLIEHIVKGE